MTALLEPEPTITRTVDARGSFCPGPLMELIRAIRESQVGDVIAVRRMGMLAIAWDHRAFDGAYAAAFLNRLKEVIETRDWAAELD